MLYPTLSKVRILALGLLIGATSPLLPQFQAGQDGVYRGSALAQTREERKVASELKKVVKLGERLEQYESGDKTISDRNIESFLKQLTRMEENLTELAGTAGQDEAMAELASVRGRLMALEEALAAELAANGGLTPRELEKQQKAIARVEQQAEKLTADVAKVNWVVVTDDRKISQFDRSLTRIEDGLEDLLETVDGYDVMLAKVEEARAAVEGARQQTTTLLEGRGAARDFLVAGFQSGKVMEDSTFLWELNSHALNVLTYVDQQSDQLVFWNGMAEAELYKTWAERLSGDMDRLASLKEEYAAVPAPLLHEVSNEMVATIGNDARTIGGLNNLLQGQLQSIEEAMAHVDALRVHAVDRTRDRIKVAQDEMARLEGELNYNDLVHGNTVNAAMAYGDAILVVLDGYKEDVLEIKETVATDMIAARAELAATTERVYDAIVASNEVPSHRYTGSDGDAMIARSNDLFADVFSGEKTGIGAFIPDEDWYRDVGERVKASGEIEKYDESRLFVTVFATEPKDYLSKWTIYVTKDHLNNDKVTYFVSERSYDDPVSPYRVYPAASITGLR